MRMYERYSYLTYIGSIFTGFFATLSLQDWGFIIGVVAGVGFTALTYRLNSREQKKRTKIMQDIADKINPGNPSATAQIINDVVQKTGTN